MSNTVGREERKYTSKEIEKVIDDGSDGLGIWFVSPKELKQKLGDLK